jgi:hypothetical protein
MRVCASLVFAALLLAGHSLGQSSATPLDLAVSTPKGTSAWFVETLEQVYETKVGDLTLATKMRVRRTFCVSVRSVMKRGHRIVEVEVVRVHGSLEVGTEDKPLEFDSATPSPPADREGSGQVPQPVLAMLAHADKKFITRIDANGRVVGSLTALVSKLGRDAPDLSGSEGSLRQLAESAFGRLPKSPVAIGAQWQHQREDSAHQLPIKQQVTVTLRASDADAFTLSFDGKITPGEPVPPELPDSMSEEVRASMTAELIKMQEEMEIRGDKLRGEQRVSRADGLVEHAEVVIDADVRMTQGGTPMDTKVKLRTTLRRTTEQEARPPKKAKPADGGR